MAVKGRSKDFQYLYTEAMSHGKCKIAYAYISWLALQTEKASSHKDTKSDISFVAVSVDQSTDISYSGRYLSECFQNLYTKTLSL